uniref:Uncharacterized protein n=1 Tax=Anguilla anguilla TaxID=7936 RepID=A0A0E9QQF9_ANGAN
MMGLSKHSPREQSGICFCSLFSYFLINLNRMLTCLLPFCLSLVDATFSNQVSGMYSGLPLCHST